MNTETAERRGRFLAIAAFYDFEARSRGWTVEGDQWDDDNETVIVWADRTDRQFHVTLYADDAVAMRAVNQMDTEHYSVEKAVDLTTGWTLKTAMTWIRDHDHLPVAPEEPPPIELCHYFDVYVTTGADDRPQGCHVSAAEREPVIVDSQAGYDWYTRDDFPDRDDAAAAYLDALLNLPHAIEVIYQSWTDGDGWDINIMSDISAHMTEHKLWAAEPEALDEEWTIPIIEEEES